jgi:hypothetical protein
MTRLSNFIRPVTVGLIENFLRLQGYDVAVNKRDSQISFIEGTMVLNSEYSRPTEFTLYDWLQYYMQLKDMYVTENQTDNS